MAERILGEQGVAYKPRSGAQGSSLSEENAAKPDENEIDRRALDAFWQEFLDNAMENLSPKERMKLSNLRSPDELLEGLSLHIEKASTHEWFEAAVLLILRLYPKVPGSTSHSGHWSQCHKILPHAISIIDHFAEAQRVKHKRVISTPEFLELLQHTTWFLYEIGDLTECIRYLEVAKSACPDESCFEYGRFCNTAACIWYERNNLLQCRENNERCIEIYERLLSADDLYLTHAYGNMAQLLHSEKRHDEALQYFSKVKEIRLKHGSITAYHLGLNYMATGRVKFKQGFLEEAEMLYLESEKTFISANSSRSWLMGSLFYDLGNLERARQNHEQARAHYSKALDICKPLGPTQILLAAIYYKLAVTNVALRAYDLASESFEKGLIIAEHHKSRGHVARLLRQKAVMIRSQVPHNEKLTKEADALDTQAKALRLEAAREIQQPEVVGESYETDEAYDSLICGYFE